MMVGNGFLDEVHPRLMKSDVNVTPTSVLREFFVLTIALLVIVL
ncbi:MAG: hypothetical protein R6W88_00700 [Desulfobacterales bacterium]